METHEQSQAAYEDELRAKYSQDDRNKMAKSGSALPDGSYPIADAEDLSNAIHAVGRGANNSHNAIRRHIIQRAKALGLSGKIPDNWNSDGSLKEQNSDGTELEHVEVDPEVLARRARAEMLEGTREVRHFHADGLEVRETSDGMLRFSGYASVTERGYEVGDFTETIARGAFKRTLSEQPDVVLLLNHEGLPLARTKSGTMTLTEDSRGLRVDADLNPNDPDVQRVKPKLERGDADEMSFAFRVTDQEWSEDRSERLIRGVTIHKGDVSIVTYGANDASTGGIVRQAAELVEMRAGKTLSAKSRQEIQASIDALNGLLTETDVVEPDPTPVSDALEALDALEDGERAAEEPVEQVSAPPVVIQADKRHRERLAALRRVA